MPRTKDPNSIKRALQEVRIVRMLVSQTAWLDGSIRLLDGSPAFEAGGQRFALTSELLAGTQRRINKVKKYGELARQVVGDVDDWSESKEQKLELAKSLRALDAKNLEELARKTRAKDKESRAKMLELLWVEALCVDTLPVSPSVVLASTHNQDGLLQIVDAGSAPDSVRALAAMTIGAVHKDTGTTQMPPGKSARPDWVKRCYNWSLKHGLTADYIPSLTLYLLQQSNGTMLATRFIAAQKASSSFPAPINILKDKMHLGWSGEKIVRLVELSAELEPLKESLLDLRDVLEWKEQVHGENFKYNVTRNRYHSRRKRLVESIQCVWSSYVGACAIDEEPERFVSLVKLTCDDGKYELRPNPQIAILTCVLKLSPRPRKCLLNVLFQNLKSLWKDQMEHAHDGAERFPPVQRKIEYLCQAAEKYADEHLVTEIANSGYLEKIPFHQTSKEQVQYFLKLIKQFDIPQWMFYSLLTIFEQYRSAAEAQQKCVEPLFRVTQTEDKVFQSHLLEIVFDMLTKDAAKLKRRLAHLLYAIPLLVEALAKDTSQDCVCWEFLSAAMTIMEHRGPESADSEKFIKWLVVLMQKSHGNWKYPRSRLVDPAVEIALHISGESLEAFSTIVTAITKRDQRRDNWLIQKSFASLKTCPALHDGLVHAAIHHTSRFLIWCENIGLASMFKTNRLKTLDTLKAAEPQRFDDEWMPVIAMFPQFEQQARRYIRAAIAADASSAPPKTLVAAARDPSAHLRKELEFLEKAPKKTATMQTRVHNLKRYLADEEGLRSRLAERIEKTLGQRIPELEWQAAENIMEQIFIDRLVEVTGVVRPKLKLDSFLLNAIFLTTDVSSNRRLLRRLLQAEVEGDFTWRHRQPGNMKFLNDIAERGIDSALWLKSNPRKFQMETTKSEVHLKLENRPLHILEMGNYFDTCLSLRGCNSFATVANACEFNKRVIYAIDEKGKVVGRKLIAINTNWEMIAFHTYTSLSTAAANLELSRIFNRYCKEFAERCGLKLGYEESNVASLIAQKWYCDGTVEWDEISEAPNSIAQEQSRAQRSPHTSSLS